MNWLLIFLNFIAFAFQNTLSPQVLNNLYLSPQHPHLFNFFTYAFMHASIGHILGNMLFLYIFGNNVNDKLGNLGYLAFYLAGAVFAGVGYVVTQSTTAPVLGASGAIAAVTGAYLVLFPISNITIVYWLVFFIGRFEVSSIFFVVFFFVQDLFFSFEKTASVAHTAHVSGSIFGFTICLILLLIRLLPRDRFDILALFGKWNRKRQFQSMVAKGYNPWEHAANAPIATATPPISAAGSPPASRPAPQSPPNPATQQLLALRGEISEAIAHHNLPHAAQLYLQLKQLDRNQVLSRQAQLDVANQLFSQHQYPQAADAYEQFLRCFPNYDQIEQVQLMLGIIYARYLHNPLRAKQMLNDALERLHAERDTSLARSELARIGPMINS
ncbi:MAG TPA: rhomboid family intramembrane serine protease [Tepidisphaeraceae bacterium]|jgi:membrane associated rhomboid family serine protease